MSKPSATDKRISTTTAQRIVMIDAITPHATQGNMTWTRGRIAQWGGGCQSTIEALISKGYAERHQAPCADGGPMATFARLTNAGIEKAEALTAALDVVASPRGRCYGRVLVARFRAAA